MDIEETISGDTASTTDASLNFGVRSTSPAASNSRNNIATDEPMVFFEDRPRSSPMSLEREVINSLRGRRDCIDAGLPSLSSSHSGPSSSSDHPVPSTSYTGYGVVDSTDETEAQEIRRIMNPEAFLTPLLGRNTMNNANTDNTIHILNESSSDIENDDNNDFPENPLPHLDVESNNYDLPNARQSDSTDQLYVASESSNNRRHLRFHDYDLPSAEQSDHAEDQLFAPEESSNSSTENSPFLSQPSTSYFKFMNNHQNSVDELSSLRTSPRYRRFIRPPLTLSDFSVFRDRDPEIPVRLTSSQRLSSYLRSRLNSRFRMRYSHIDPFSRHKTTAALNAVSSNGDGASLTNASEAREMNARPYRRNLCLPKFNNESRFHTHVTPTECENNRYHRIVRPDRPLRSPAFLRSIIDIDNCFRPFPRPLTSNIRARSVSPTSANPSVSAPIHDEPLDDIGINLRSDSSHNTAHRFLSENPDGQVQRPSTPLPPVLSPTLSDDDMELITLSPQNSLDSSRILTPPIPTECKSDVCRQPVNVTLNLTDKCNTKEAPRTYEDLNNELIQLLECPICFEYTTPPINQCLQGHIICNTCRQRVTTCPTCRTIFQESRNLVMEKVAALLRYPCKNAVTGCLEFLYLLQKEQHEMACGFRQYSCFLPLCNWRGYKPELLVHVQETHENHVIHGPSTNLLIPVSGQTKRVWLMSAFNELFYVIFFTTLGILKGCVRFIGDSSKCDNYTYNISVTSEEDMLRNFNYTRTTHAYEESFENIDMIDSYDLFSISHAQLHLFRKGTKAPVRVTIEEAQKRTGLTTPISSSAS